MKKVFAAVCSVCLAVASCSAFYCPVVAHADAGEFAGAVDYFTSLSGEEATAFAASDGGTVAGVILGLYLCTQNPISTGSTVDASTLAYSIGTYYNGNTIKCGTMVSPAGQFTGQDGFTFAFSDDYELVATATGVPTNLKCEAHTGSGWKYFTYLFTPTYSGSDRLNVVISNRKSQSGVLTGSYNCTWGSYAMGCAYDITGGSPQLSGVTLSSVCTGDFNGSSGRGRFLGNTQYGQLPSGELDLANPTAYIENTVRPWVQENYPDYTFLLPSAPAPEPEYPTDFVTGIPKDWTIQNPVLPTSPSMDIEVPDASLPDLSGVTEYTEGVGFWWALTGWIMDTFGIRQIVLLLIGIGVLSFVLYRLGAG